MTKYALQARLKMCDPRLRLITGRVVFLPGGRRIRPVALYRGYQYCGFTLSSSYVERKTKEAKFNHTWNPQRKAWWRELVEYPIRGRRDFLRLLYGFRFVRHRAFKQLLSYGG